MPGRWKYYEIRSGRNIFWNDGIRLVPFWDDTTLNNNKNNLVSFFFIALLQSLYLKYILQYSYIVPSAFCSSFGQSNGHWAGILKNPQNKHETFFD